jgi:hypothetical protein
MKRAKLAEMLCGLVAVILMSVMVAGPAAASGVTSSFTPALVITNIFASYNSRIEAAFVWETNGSATSRVFLDTTSHVNVEDYAWQSVEDPAPVTRHCLQLAISSSYTTYHYRVKSVAVVNDIQLVAISDDRILPQLNTSDGGGRGVAVSYKQLRISILGTIVTVWVGPSGALLASCIITDPQETCKLELAQGTKITSNSGETLTGIEVRLREEQLPIPNSLKQIGPCYDIIGYINDSVVSDVKFDQPAKLTLNYELGWLPQDVSSVIIGCYNSQQGWRELESSTDNFANHRQVTVLIDRSSILTILAKLRPPLTPSIFELSDLVINPVQINAGKPVNITVLVRNNGESEGKCTLTLTINGKIEQSQETTLAGGASTQLSFVVFRDIPGIYAVAVDVLTGQFNLLAPAPPPPPASSSLEVSTPLAESVLQPASSQIPASPPSWINSHWWVALIVTVIFGLLVLLRAITFKNLN